MQTEANKMRAWLNISENINNAEFWEFVRLTKDKTGLPFDIYLDDNSAYIHHRHELWLYVNYNGTKIPITIEDDPKIKFINPNGIGDLTLLFHFIRENKGAIVSLANGKIDYEIFVKLIKPVSVSDFSFVPSTSKSYLTEMATLRPNKSKLRKSQEKAHYFSGGMNPVLHIYKIFHFFTSSRILFEKSKIFINTLYL